MKTSFSFHQYNSTINFFILLFFLCTSNEIYCQSPHRFALDNPNHTLSSLYEMVNSSNTPLGYIGLGVPSPFANFHIKGPSLLLPNYSIFQVETAVGANIGSIKFFYYDGNRVSGILQTGPQNNSFDGPTDFNSTLTCSRFILLENKGYGRVLMSDAVGKGIWTDPSTLVPQLWLVCDNKIDFYADKNYEHIGIGTNKPLQKLHVVNGNILISRQDHQTKSSGSLNGSLLFGEIVTDDYPNGEWGIEYYNPDHNGDFTKGGLNFFQVYKDATHQGSNYNIFIRNDGHVGIGTPTPQSELAVNGKVTAKEFEATLDGWPDYVFNTDYNLRSIPELENYIQINKHLPEIPSEQEVKEQGVKLGEMNALLVKKVEELTLYIIKMQKEIDALKADHQTK